MKRMLPLLALCALALPASAAWTYVADPGAWNNQNDKKYSGYVTDGTTWTIFVLDLGDGTWQLGAGTYGVDGGSGGSCQAGTTKTSTGIGSGALDVCEIAADTGMVFSKIGPRCFNSHGGITAITIPETVVEFGSRAFYGSKIATFTFENGCPNLATIGTETFRSVQQCAELDLGSTILTTIPNANFDASLGFHRIVFPETLTTLANQALGWITDDDLVIHFKGAMPSSIASNAIRSRSNSANQKWAFYVDVNTKGSWPIRTDVSFADAQAKLPSVSGETFSEDDYLGYVYPSDLGNNGNGTSMKIWVFKEGVAGETIPATMSVASSTGRTNATVFATVDLGTSSAATVSVTVGETTKTATTNENGTLSFAFDGFSLETTYAWTATVQGSDDAYPTKLQGSFTTVGPDVKLGATDYVQPDDGLSATLTVNVTQLLSGTADIVLSRDEEDLETKTVDATGIVSFEVTGLTLAQTYTYTFTAISSENGDVATATLTFMARPYHWEYTPNGGETQAWPWDGTTAPQAGTEKQFNGQPYHGTITDGRWVFCVYHNSAWRANEFWLGEGNSGSTAYMQKGLPDIDLSGVYADTGVKLVGIGGYAFDQRPNDIHSIVFPKFITHIGKQAFYKCSNLKEIDLGGTSLTNVLEMGFQDCTGVTNVILPRTLQKLGGTALAWGPASRVIHFRGDVPEVEPSISSGTKGADQALYSGANNRQWAYCVDAVRYPRWKTDASTTLYDESNPFPSGELDWVPAPVRYPAKLGRYTFPKPFGNSTLGRGHDASKDGRAYLIQEYASDPTSLMILR